MTRRVDLQPLRGCPLDGPPELKPLHESCSRKTDEKGEVCYGPLPSLVCDLPRGARIVHLLETCNPVTVLWRIWASVVDAIKAVAFRGSASHVGQKCLERIRPALADRDATPAVVGIDLSVGIIASGLHTGPDSILVRLGHAVSQLAVSCNFSAQTPATFRLSRNHGISADSFSVSAGTEAYKRGFMWSFWRNVCSDSKAVEGVSDKVLRHTREYITVNIQDDYALPTLG